jgi:hypothetical protein
MKVGSAKAIVSSLQGPQDDPHDMPVSATWMYSKNANSHISDGINPVTSELLCSANCSERKRQCLYKLTALQSEHSQQLHLPKALEFA